MSHVDYCILYNDGAIELGGSEKVLLLSCVLIIQVLIHIYVVRLLKYL